MDGEIELYWVFVAAQEVSHGFCLRLRLWELAAVYLITGPVGGSLCCRGNIIERLFSIWLEHKVVFCLFPNTPRNKHMRWATQSQLLCNTPGWRAILGIRGLPKGTTAVVWLWDQRPVALKLPVQFPFQTYCTSLRQSFYWGRFQHSCFPCSWNDSFSTFGSGQIKEHTQYNHKTNTDNTVSTQNI